MAHIEKRGARRYKARYRGPDGREYSHTFARKVDAEHFLTAVEAAKLRGEWVDPNLAKTPFSRFVAEVMMSKLSIRPATRAKYESLIRNHIVPAFSDVPVSKINRAAVQRFVGNLSEQGLAPATVAECYMILSGVMAEAVEAGYVSQSPCRRVSLPRAEHKERRFLSPEQVETLVTALPQQHSALVLTAAYLGLRWEELAGLKRKHLDLERRELRVVGTIERAAGRYRYVEEVKSASSRRTLRLPTFLVRMLGEHLKAAPLSEYVFPSAEGGFLRYDNFMPRVWAKATKAADLGGLTFHELRHTCAAILIDQGANPLEIQRRLGHKDIKTTLGTYGHLFPNREDALNETLERVHREARAASPRPEVASIEQAKKRKAASTRGDDGGRYWDRTSDLFGVNEALSR